MSNLPRRAPRTTSETEAFWQACAEHRLVLPACKSCITVYWYPRQMCPVCGSRDVDLIAASGRGRIYTFTVMRSGSGPYRDHAPYVVALVELDEGVRMLTNIVDVKMDAVHIGLEVEVMFDDAEHGAIPRFRPVAD
jgi:uncharacterized OB-fold protein